MSDAEESPVLHHVADGVGVVTLNRPERLNAWTPEMEAAFFAALDELVVDPAVVVVVLTGAGHGFCAGLDAARVAARGSGAERAPTRTRPLSSLAAYPKPVVAAVNGAAVGLGLALALCCDTRMAADTAKFATMFSRLGLVGEFGAPWLLPRVVGWGAASDLMLSGRTVGAAEAAGLRLVERVVPAAELLPTALAYAGEIARSCSPLAVAATKQVMRADQERPFAASEPDTSARNRTPQVRAEFREGAAHRREHRPAAFPGLPADHPDVLAWLGEPGPVPVRS
jgi:enoyl-CoA hydratase/carnithine racemase